MIVFHGTGGYNLEGLQTSQPRCRMRAFHKDRKSFCTTTQLSVAELFALRHTTCEAFLKGLIDGIIVEYELHGKEGKDYDSVRDPRSLQEESEIAIFNTKVMQLVAVWRHVNGSWQRQPLTKGDRS